MAESRFCLSRRISLDFSTSFSLVLRSRASDLEDLS